MLLITTASLVNFLFVQLTTYSTLQKQDIYASTLSNNQFPRKSTQCIVSGVSSQAYYHLQQYTLLGTKKQSTFAKCTKGETG